MKKMKLFALGMVGSLLLVGGASLGGLAAAGVFEEKQEVEETQLIDLPTGDKVGVKFEGSEASVATAAVHKSLGVQLTTNEAAGTYNMRFVAALTNVNGITSAKWVRSDIKDGDGAIVKASSELEIDTYYSGVEDFDSIKWDEAPDTSVYTKYFVYTLKNIPETYKMSVIDVSLSLGRIGLSGVIVNEEANVQGLLGTGIVNAEVVAYGDEPGHYRAQRPSTGYGSITEVVVPERYYSIDGFVATDMGVIDRLEHPVSSTGAFEACSSLVSITLPDTINYMDTYTFYSCRSILEITLPRDLVDIQSNSLSGLSGLQTLHYDAVNLNPSTTSANFGHSINDVYVSTDVESLYSGFASGSSYHAVNVHFEGTIAEFNAIPNADSHFWSAGYLYASDSVIRTVTFHYEGGTLGENPDSHSIEILSGYTIDNPGRPSKDGYLFDSWVLNLGEEDEAEYDFSALVTSDLDIYAKFITNPDGFSLDQPLEITAAGTYTPRTMMGMPTMYIKFTAPATDVYYFYAHDFVVDTNADNYNNATSVSDSSIFLNVYDANKESVSLSTWSMSTKAAAARYRTDSNNVMLTMTEGESMYVAFTGAYSSGYIDSRVYYGSATLDIFTADGDDVTNPATYTLGDTQPITLEHRNVSKFYSLDVTTADTYVMSLINDGDNYISVEIYDSNDGRVDYISRYTSVTESVELDAGSYIIRVYGSSFYTSEEVLEEDGVSFCIRSTVQGESATNPIAYTIGSEGTWSSVAGSLSAVWYSFTADATTTYIITNNSTSSSATINVYNAAAPATSLINVSGSSNGAKGDLDVEAGETYLICVNNTSYSPTDFTWKIEAAPAGYSFNLAIDITEDASDGSVTIETVEGSISGSSSVSTTGGRYYKIDVAALENVEDSRFVRIVADADATATIALFTGASHTYKNRGSEVYANIGGDATMIYLWIGDTAASSVTLTITYPDSIANGLSEETPFLSDSFFTHATTGALGGEGVDLWYKEFSAEEPFSQQYMYVTFNVETDGDYYFYTLNYSSSTSFDSKLSIYKDAFKTSSDGYNDDWSSSVGLTRPDTAHRYNACVAVTGLTAGQTICIRIQLPSSGYVSSYMSSYQAWSMRVEKKVTA